MRGANGQGERRPGPEGPEGIIWLIGMMGVGKTTVGRLLAEQLGREFVDLDRRVEEVAGRSISDIFAGRGAGRGGGRGSDLEEGGGGGMGTGDGEAGFRVLEARLARELAEQTGHLVGPVVATGGGTPCHGDTLAHMHASGLVVWLRAEVDELLPHLDMSGRPLLRDAPDPRARLRELEAARHVHYRQADLVIDRRGRTPAELAAEVVGWIKAYGRAPLAALPLESTTRIEVRLGERSYPVLIDPGLGAELRFAGHLGRRAPPGRTRLGLVTDERVAALHGERYRTALVERGYEVVMVTVPPGEAAKSLGEVERVAQALVAGGLDRRSLVVALGGGVVGDLAGFVASILYRGIAFAQVPTTLLAQVDASVGGKTGVNLGAGKNLVGSFHQPLLVYADMGTLGTLEARDLQAGLAEVVKHGLLAGGALLDRLEAEAEAARRGEPGLIAELVAASCALKARVVANDEREQDERGGRALLNLGHTVGHALETASLEGPAPWRHGEAVALGLVAAMRVSRALGAADHEPRVVRLLARLGLPVDLDRYLSREVLAHVGVDKKRAGAAVRFVVLDAPGSARLVALPLDRLFEILCPRPGSS
ncbi:MAG TPA: 3-dehydroquinate synthase [Polyangia bacterium]|nr:3-dehydroquinate synthase [Polyangia bacterium]